MKKVLVFLVVIIVLVVGGGAAAYYLNVLPSSVTQVLSPATPTPVKPANLAPTPTEDPGFEVVVARFDIPGGTLISNTQMLDTKNIPTRDYEARAANIFKSSQIGDTQGKLLNVSISAGRIIEKSFLSEPGLSQQLPTAEKDRPRPKAYPVEVDTYTGVANQIHEGDTVDVVVTFKFKRQVYLPPLMQIQASSPGTAAQPPVSASASVGQTVEKDFYTTKTIVQRAKVLAIVRPPPPTPPPAPPDQQPAETTKPQAGAATAPAANASPAPVPTKEEERLVKQQITSGKWQVVLAVNDQQAELIELTRQTPEAVITLVLRGAGDSVYEKTMGATFDLLLSEFGLPLPQPEDPFVFSPDVLTPLPTRTPASGVRIP